MMLPTAREARGRPAIRATSPYVATRPGGIRRTTSSTRAEKGSGVFFVLPRGIVKMTPDPIFDGHPEHVSFGTCHRCAAERRECRRDVCRCDGLRVPSGPDASSHQD